jgi:cell division protein FtsL
MGRQVSRQASRHTIARVRAIAFAGSDSFSAELLKQWGTRLVATLLCLGGALLLTATRIETTRLRYDLNELHQTRQALKTDVERMGLEVANLSRPQRIERLAKARGLIYPRRGQVVGMDE